ASGPGDVTTMTVGSGSFLFISYDGIFTDGSGFFNSQSAEVSFTFTQASPGSTLGEVASFSTAAAAVPQPASLAPIGSRLVLVGLIARKKEKAYLDGDRGGAGRMAPQAKATSSAAGTGTRSVASGKGPWSSPGSRGSGSTICGTRSQAGWCNAAERSRKCRRRWVIGQSR